MEIYRGIDILKSYSPGNNQCIVLHLASIEGRSSDKFLWSSRSKQDMWEYEKGVIYRIVKSFSQYPAIFGACPPHAGTLWAFEGNNAKVIARMRVDAGNMDIVPEHGKFSPLDIKVMNYELDNWLVARKCPEAWYEQPRFPEDIVARVLEEKQSRSGI